MRLDLSKNGEIEAQKRGGSGRAAAEEPLLGPTDAFHHPLGVGPDLVVPRGLDGPLAAVSWPTSGTLVVAEVVTGGTSASDEYVEVANAGSVPADLAGLELAYATSSGATVTKKASWTSQLLLAPGQHLLLANASGAYSSIADALYTTGLAATGGAIVLRVTGGAVVDAVGWGDAAAP